MRYLQKHAIVFKTYAQSAWAMHRKTFMSRDEARAEAQRMLDAGTHSVVIHWLDLSEPKKKGDEL